MVPAARVARPTLAAPQALAGAASAWSESFNEVTEVISYQTLDSNVTGNTVTSMVAMVQLGGDGGTAATPTPGNVGQR